MIGLLIWVVNLGNKYKIQLAEINAIKIIIQLEELKLIIPYVLKTYYKKIIENKLNLIPSILTTSYWRENSQWKKEMEETLEVKYIINVLKRLSFFFSLIMFLVIIILWIFYNSDKIEYQTSLNLDINIDNKESISTTTITQSSSTIKLGMDALSISFVWLTVIIMPLAYLSNWTSILNDIIYYFIILSALGYFLIIVFLVIDLTQFYVFFESILPFLFGSIGLYGALQKYRAAYYLFLYTLLGSLFMLVSFMKMGGDLANVFFASLSFEQFFILVQILIWSVLLISFSVKTPVIPFHIWLPLAHADANVSGSIILAAIVLKLALYAFLRIAIGILVIASLLNIPMVFCIAGWSILYASFTTIRQVDLKVIVAYSSVAHMGSTLLGAYSDNNYGILGSIIFGLSHGFVSPALFFIVGAVLYDRCGSRIINYYKGLSNIIPLFALLFLLFTFGNMGVPLTGNFIGEFLSLLGAYQQNIYIAAIGTTSVILSAVYSIFMFNRVTSGSLSPFVHTLPDIFRKEFFLLLPLLGLMLILGTYPTWLTSEIEFGLSSFLLFSITPIKFMNNNNNNNNNQNNQNNNNRSDDPNGFFRETEAHGIYMSVDPNNNTRLFIGLEVEQINPAEIMAVDAIRRRFLGFGASNVEIRMVQRPRPNIDNISSDTSNRSNYYNNYLNNRNRNNQNNNGNNNNNNNNNNQNNQNNNGNNNNNNNNNSGSSGNDGPVLHSVKDDFYLSEYDGILDFLTYISNFMSFGLLFLIIQFIWRLRPLLWDLKILIYYNMYKLMNIFSRIKQNYKYNSINSTIDKNKKNKFWISSILTLDFGLYIINNYWIWIISLFILSIIINLWRKYKDNIFLLWIQYNSRTTKNKYINKNNLLYVRLIIILFGILFWVISGCYKLLGLDIKILQDLISEFLVHCSIIHVTLLEYYYVYSMKYYMIHDYILGDINYKVYYPNSDEKLSRIFFNESDSDNETSGNRLNPSSIREAIDLTRTISENTLVPSDTENTVNLSDIENTVNPSDIENIRNSSDNNLNQTRSDNLLVRKRSEDSSSLTRTNSQANEDIEDIINKLKVDLNPKKRKMSAIDEISSDEDDSDDADDDTPAMEERRERRAILHAERDELDILREDINDLNKDARSMIKSKRYETDPNENNDLRTKLNTIKEKEAKLNEKTDYLKTEIEKYNKDYRQNKLESEFKYDSHRFSQSNKRPRFR
jgi:NADH-ubiquinone oxidoreductase chain 4